MSRFKGIPIRIEVEPEVSGTAVAGRVLREIESLLERLLETGEGSAIDLRALPALGVDGYGLLKDTLGQGEVSARIEGLGCTEIRETAYPGVWWSTHRNQKTEIVTELIEITEVPALLKSQHEDVRTGLARLSRRLPTIG